MKPKLQVSVRMLVDGVLRTGDLDMRFSSPGRSLEGIRIHQKIQRQRPANYRPEVPVSMEVETPEMVLAVAGRIDGVMEVDGLTRVEEIKSTTADLEELAERRNPCHWGQAKAYAYLLASEQNLESVAVQVTYCHVDTAETIEQSERLTFTELEAFFRDLVSRYLQWATTLIRWRHQRDVSIAAVDFPFPFRPGQRDMAVAVYRTIRDGGQALIQAATGIGKTMAALFPAIKTLESGETDRIFFLTARNTGKTAALQALNLLQEQGLACKRVCLTAKDQICFCPEAACTPDQCRYAKGHFDRLGAALQAAFIQDSLDREAIEAIAESHSVCPFEFSLELARWADCIVCDYNYAFDPRVYLRRFFDEENGAYTFLVDEAHNLVDRSREMFSAQLKKTAFLELRRAVKSHLPSVYRAAGKINTWMLEARRTAEASGGFRSEAVRPEGLEPLLRGFLRTAERWLAKNQPAPYQDLVMERYFEATAFSRVWERYDGSYVTCYHAGRRDLIVKLFCLDPADQLEAALQRCRAAIFFSATLTPGDYFREILGCTADAARLAIGSPFPHDHLQVFVARDIVTYYRQREQSIASISRLIRAFIGQKRGNYLCFFPSYDYMAMVAEKFEAEVTDVRILIQSRDMDDIERTRFLESFSESKRKMLVGFAVMGGIFGEGVDLVGERLSGAVIVGVGLPGISPERDLIRRHFDERGKGFDYAYRYPGINRVLQAAGRVIRTSRDKGALLLLDRRFGDVGYRGLLPGHWSILDVQSSRQLKERLTSFWSFEEGDPI